MCPESLDSKAVWEVWYQDTFDIDCPRQVECFGHALVDGLSELWARHLYETVQVNGQKGFSKFNLWWKQEQKSIEIVGEWEGQVRLRRWIFGDMQETKNQYGNAENSDIIKHVAGVHKKLILKGETSEKILEEAKRSMSREEFIKSLLTLE